MLADTKTKHKNGRATSKPHAAQENTDGHLLPGVPEVGNTGIRIVRRAVSLTFLVLGVGVVGALAVASVVSIDVTVEANGILRPTQLWPVRSVEPGIIVEAPLASGDTVRQGQVVVRLDSLQLKSDLSQLQAQRNVLHTRLRKKRFSRGFQKREQEQAQDRAKAQLVQARADLRKELVVFGHSPDVDPDSFLVHYTLGSKTRLDRAVAQVRSAEANLRSAEIEGDRTHLSTFDLQQQRAEDQRLRSQIQSLRKRIGRLSVAAPASGVVLTDRLEQMTGSFVQRGELLLEIAKLDQWQANLYISEHDIEEVEVGDPAKIEIQAFRSDHINMIRGRVASIASEPMETGERVGEVGASGRYRVVVRLEREVMRNANRDRLRQGYSVRGQIITRSGRIITLLWNHLRNQTR